MNIIYIQAVNMSNLGRQWDMAFVLARGSSQAQVWDDQSIPTIPQILGIGSTANSVHQIVHASFPATVKTASYYIWVEWVMDRSMGCRHCTYRR